MNFLSGSELTDEEVEDYKQLQNVINNTSQVDSIDQLIEEGREANSARDDQATERVTAAVEVDRDSNIITLSDLGGSATKIIIKGENGEEIGTLNAVGETFTLEGSGPYTVVASNSDESNQAVIRTIDSI